MLCRILMVAIRFSSRLLYQTRRLGDDSIGLLTFLAVYDFLLWCHLDIVNPELGLGRRCLRLLGPGLRISTVGVKLPR